MPDPITLTLGRIRARIDPERGSNLLDLHYLKADRWLPIIARNVPGEDARANPASFIMAPWCNRIRDAAFTWNNKRIALKPDPRDGTAMHGDVRKRPWHILDRSPISARLQFDSTDFPDLNFPREWPFRLIARYEVGESSLKILLHLHNTGPEPFPCGLGIHPYFPREQTPGVQRVRIAAPCEGRFPSDRCMPIGPARCDALTRRLATPNFIPPGYQMDSYRGYHAHTEITWPQSRLTMTSAPDNQHMVFFAPTDERGFESPFFAVEPMTIAANGFNALARGEPPSNHGVRILQPGESLTTWHNFQMSDS